jgi:hypothetical protein
VNRNPTRVSLREEFIAQLRAIGDILDLATVEKKKGELANSYELMEEAIKLFGNYVSFSGYCKPSRKEAGILKDIKRKQGILQRELIKEMINKM